MNYRRILVSTLATLLVLAGFEGQVIAGKSANGRSANGRSANGRSANGVSLNGVYLQNAYFSTVSLDGSVLTATDEFGETFSGPDLVGAQLTATLDDDSVVVLTIDGFQAPEQGSDIAFYTASFEAEDDNGVLTTYSLCEYDNANQPIQAIALSGLWNYDEGVPGGGDKIADPDSFTFACRGYALAKCVEFGYEPWETATECKNAWTCHEISLAHHHQSCVRMLRADFCGDGMPHTQDGTGVNLWDDLGIQTQAWTPLWLFEAEWGVGGATCVSHSRLYSLDLGTLDPLDTIADYALLHCPDKLLDLQNILSCGGSGSDFYVQNGYYTPPVERSFIMTKSETLGL